MARKIDLRPQPIDLMLYSGDGARFTLTVTDVNDSAVDLTGDVIAQIRAKRDDVEALADFNVDLTDHANGVAVLTLTKEDTLGLLAGGTKFNGFWDLQWTPDGETDRPRTLAQGKVECDLDVSR